MFKILFGAKIGYANCIIPNQGGKNQETQLKNGDAGRSAFNCCATTNITSLLF
ncbi:MAG: hypothetical protein HC912_01140 [Saprospiraceae bacterium]|nr:hypothetical protein [Saprospiraceae bacterium]